MIVAALNARYLEVSAREREERPFKIGPSNLGDCQRKLAFQLQGFESRPLSAETARVFELGHQRGERLEELAKEIFPDAKSQVPVRLALNNGQDQLYGTADLWIPSKRILVDFKTVGAYGAGSLATEGVSEEYQLQVHTYRQAIGEAEAIAPATIKALLIYEVKDSDARKGVKAGQLIEVEVPWDELLHKRWCQRIEAIEQMYRLNRQKQLDPFKIQGLPKSHWKCRNDKDGQPLYCPIGSREGRCHE